MAEKEKEEEEEEKATLDARSSFCHLAQDYRKPASKRSAAPDN